MEELLKPFSDYPNRGQAQEITTGVLWIALPLPYPPGFVNVWLIDEGDSWTLVDTGMDTSMVRETWELVFKNVLKGRPISRLICTHSHEDHMGLAGWIQERYPAALWTTQAEWLFGRAVNGQGWGIDASAFFLSAGMGKNLSKQFNGINHPYGDKSVPVPAQYTRIKENESLVIGGKNWKAIIGLGHSQEHLCLYCEELNLLISGDILLPEIFPVLCIFPNEPDEDSIEDYLDALPKFEKLPKDTLVLPAHGLPFKGLHQRITSTYKYHEEKLGNLLSACETPISARQLILKLHPNRTHPKSQLMILSETIARLNHLRKKGAVKRHMTDNIWLYQRT
ncbi:MAG: MBL fold metallo-hydrolase [Rhodospirillales bacterium]|nr:MBL fold metallo-hydrolase [Rhodospirillales bacterium]